MSTVAASSRVMPSPKRGTANLATKLVASAAILTIAVFFVLRYVFRYYLHYNHAAFTDPLRGAANYWAMRGWLLMHMTGGLVALLTGHGSSGRDSASAISACTDGQVDSFSVAWRLAPWEPSAWL